MTVSIPLPMSPQAAPGGQPATTPGKGVSSKAHGPAGTPAKPGAAGEEAASVADMFAALVATLTEEMQPATEGTEAAAPAEAGPEADAALAGVAAQAVPVVVLPVTDTAAVATAATATTATETVPTDLVAPLPGTETAPADGEPVVDGEAAADTDHPGLGAERRATPAVRATPATHADGVTTPAQPAVPAQPAARIVGEPATATPPATVEESDPAVTPVTTGPAARAARPDAPARVTIPAAPVRAADAHVQVARVVRPLRLGNDGAYELALDLTPAELGRVRIDVELRGSTISLSLRADNPATRDLLQQSMGQLRSELEAAGLQAGQLDVGSRGADDRGATGGRGHGSDAAADSADELLFVAPTATDLTDLDPSAGLDVRA